MLIADVHAQVEDYLQGAKALTMTLRLQRAFRAPRLELDVAKNTTRKRIVLGQATVANTFTIHRILLYKLSAHLCE